MKKISKERLLELLEKEAELQALYEQGVEHTDIYEEAMNQTLSLPPITRQQHAENQLEDYEDSFDWRLIFEKIAQISQTIKSLIEVFGEEDFDISDFDITDFFDLA